MVRSLLCVALVTTWGCSIYNKVAYDDDRAKYCDTRTTGVVVDGIFAAVAGGLTIVLASGPVDPIGLTEKTVVAGGIGTLGYATSMLIGLAGSSECEAVQAHNGLRSEPTAP